MKVLLVYDDPSIRNKTKHNVKSKSKSCKFGKVERVCLDNQYYVLSNSSSMLIYIGKCEVYTKLLFDVNHRCSEEHRSV